MKIFYGVQATGRGHFSRYLVAREMLEHAGHSVYGYSTGRELPAYARGIEEFEPGPSFFVCGNRVDLLRSFQYNATHLRAYYRSVSQLTRFIRECSYDQAIVDFEPVSARALRRARVPFTIFDNQSISLTPFEWSGSARLAAKGLATFVRFYYGGLGGAKRILTYSFAPLESRFSHHRIIPPCVRREVLELQPSQGEHILFYSSVGQLPPGLVEFARANPRNIVKAYAPGLTTAVELPPNIILPGLDSAGYLQDFASCHVFVGNAGFESLAEAIHLRKPVLVVPIRGQWEQQINGFLVTKFSIGQTASDFSRATFEAAIRHETAPAENVRNWVLHGRETLEEELRKW